MGTAEAPHSLPYKPAPAPGGASLPMRLFPHGPCLPPAPPLMRRDMERRHPEQCRGWVGFSVKMAHRITAGEAGGGGWVGWGGVGVGAHAGARPGRPSSSAGGWRAEVRAGMRGGRCRVGRGGGGGGAPPPPPPPPKNTSTPSPAPGMQLAGSNSHSTLAVPSQYHTPALVPLIPTQAPTCCSCPRASSPAASTSSTQWWVGGMVAGCHLLSAPAVKLAAP